MRKEVGLNKKAQGLSTSAIILIVLGVIILAILAVGFLAGWGVFKDIFSGVPGTENNVAQISQACQTACSIGSSYDWCTTPRIVTGVEALKDNQDLNCNNLAKDGTHAKEVGNAIKACPEITC